MWSASAVGALKDAADPETPLSVTKDLPSDAASRTCGVRAPSELLKTPPTRKRLCFQRSRASTVVEREEGLPYP
ncbi:hypothetical protein NDU88_004653 [Pleurodeles waltl]|uniref:Uncharacterized protein n=1 Tax=Pleurodeles waltl TaxID=8319 RepID=A0AAV7NK74_PLEWA|nr:hypothetical protein NDU88_004653 [Pleurodeles waltl]